MLEFTVEVLARALHKYEITETYEPKDGEQPAYCDFIIRDWHRLTMLLTNEERRQKEGEVIQGLIEMGTLSPHYAEQFVQLLSVNKPDLSCERTPQRPAHNGDIISVPDLGPLEPY